MVSKVELLNRWLLPELHRLRLLECILLRRTFQQHRVLCVLVHLQTVPPLEGNVGLQGHEASHLL